MTAWITNQGSVFVPTAQHWVNAMIVGLVCYFGFHMGYEAFNGRPMVSADKFFTGWLPGLVFVKAILTYWSRPLPWSPVSFHQLIPSTATYLTNLLNAATMAQSRAAMDDLLSRVPVPDSVIDIRAQVGYWLATWAVWIPEGIMFAFGTLSLVALAVGITAGPLSAALRIFPPMAHLFRNWLDYMVSWASYGMVSAIVLNIWSMAIVLGIPRIFHSTGIIEAIVLAKAFCFINIALIVSCLQIERMAAALFGHAVSGAAGYPDQIRRMI